MDFIISLSHFCETHGPTTVLCTQLSPISCGTCFPISTPPSEDISKNSSFSGSFWEPASPAVISPQTAFPLNSPFASPPTSPKSPNINYNPYFGSFGADHDVISRRFSLNSEPESDGCDNCNFVISKDMSERLPNGAPGSPTKNGKGQHGSPILRTTQPIVAHGSEEDEEEDDEDSPTGSFAPHNSHLGTSPSTSQGSRLNLSVSSPFYPQKTHFHNLTYVTRRQPESQSVYSRLRHSCVRTLTCETLPRGSPSGPLLFGDPIAGYTIAYIFRLPDPRARGKRRTYALTALGRDCWRVIAAMVQVTKAFESIASQIISMADRVLERESALMSRPSIPDLLKTHELSSSAPVDPVTPTPASPQGWNRAKSSANSPVTTPVSNNQRVISDVSSFLAAKKVDPDGYPRFSKDLMRAKGLAEIVGKENFFVELHAQFCVILANLVKELSR